MDVTPLSRGGSPTPLTPAPRRDDGASDFAEVFEHEALEEPRRSEARPVRERERPNDEPATDAGAFAFGPAGWTDVACLAALPREAAPPPETEAVAEPAPSIGTPERESAAPAPPRPTGEAEQTDAAAPDAPTAEAAPETAPTAETAPVVAAPATTPATTTTPATATAPVGAEAAPVDPRITNTAPSSPAAATPATTAERGLPTTTVAAEETPLEPRRGPANADSHSLDATTSQDPSPTSEGPAPAAGEAEDRPVESPTAEPVAGASQEASGGQPQPFSAATPIEPAAIAPQPQVAAPSIAPPAVAVQSGATTPVAPVAPMTPAAPAAQAGSIVQQVQVAIRPGMSEARIALTPPELGKVAVRLLLRGGSLEARIVAETPAARVELEKHKVELERALSQDGQTVRVEVVSQEPAGVSADARGGSDARHGHGAREDWSQRERPGAPYQAPPSHPAFTAPERRAVRASRLDTLA